MEEKTLRMSMLIDFFGDLLTDKQREYFDLYHNEDLSLSEIAERAGISRQGVYDIITRAEKSLEAFEEKTGVIKRFGEMRKGLESALLTARELHRLSNGGETTALAQELVTALEELSGQ